MNQRHLFFIMLAMLTMMLFSCTQTENGNVEYIPFQETKDGQWGMISMDGKVLFKEEFKNKPTVVRDGRFFVRTKEGTWEMYDATEKPKKIGVEYAHTSGFRNGRALVAVKNQPVSIIDTEGKIVKLLDKIEGKIVEGVNAFNGGYAVFLTSDSLEGVINQNGDCVIKPKYCYMNSCGDGKFIAIKTQYKKDIQNDKKEKVKLSVLDTDGKVLFEFSGDKYEDIGQQFVDGKLAVCVKKDGKKAWGIINDKGETIVKPSEKFKNIGTIQGDVFTYNNGDGWGLMNVKGETLVRAKYEQLYYDDDNTLVAVVKNGDSYEYKYIDEKDNQIGNDTYVKATLFRMFDGKHALVKPNDKIYSIIDKRGNQLEGLPDITDISTYEGEDFVESDYVDIDKLIAGFDISQYGLIGLTFKSSPQQVVKMEVELGWAFGDKEHKEGSPYWYDYKDDIQLYKDVEGIRGHVFVDFTGKMSRQTYRTKRVIDYTFGDYYWYHDDKIPTGYVWNNVTPSMFALVIDNGGRMHGKLRSLFKALSALFKKYGKIAKENNGAIVLTLNNGFRALVYMEKDKVSAYWGDLKPVKDIDIDKYKDVEEEGSVDDSSYGYLNNDFADDVTVDSAAVDDEAVLDTVF